MSDTLWFVEIDEDDGDYDEFVAATVWAPTAEDAERIMREAPRRGDHSGHADDLPTGPWIRPNWRLRVKPAPAEGVALVHWHAG